MARARPARRESRMYAGTEYAWRGERGETCARARAVIRGGRDGAAGDDATRWGGGGAGATNARVAIGGGGHRTGRVCAGVGAGNGGWGTPIDDRDTATRACVQEWPPTHAMLHLWDCDRSTDRHGESFYMAVITQQKLDIYLNTRDTARSIIYGTLGSPHTC